MPVWAHLSLQGASRLPELPGRAIAGAGNGALFCKFLVNILQFLARFRLYRHRYLEVNTRFSALLEIYKII